MRKATQEIHDFFALYGINVEKKDISKIFREHVKRLTGEESEEWSVAKILEELLSGDWIVRDIEKFSEALGIDIEKKRMLLYSSNGYNVVFNEYTDVIKLIPYRQMYQSEKVDERFEKSSFWYEKVLNDEKKRKYDLIKQFNRKEAFEYLRTEVNRIFKNFNTNEELAWGLAKMTEQSKKMIRNYLRTLIEKNENKEANTRKTKQTVN